MLLIVTLEKYEPIICFLVTFIVVIASSSFLDIVVIAIVRALGIATTGQQSWAWPNKNN